MKKLKECKNFAELYQVIGEENFSDVAKLLIAVLVASPLFWGIINYGMLLTPSTYDAYTYNDKCLSLMFALFAIITLWSLLYYCGKIEYNKKNIGGCINTMNKNNQWILPWIGLLVWTVIPIAFSANIAGAIIGVTFLSSGYITHIFGFGILGCAALLSESDRKDVFRSFVWIADFLAIVMLSFEYSIPVLWRFSAAGGLSVYTNENHYGYYLAMACMVMMGLYIESISRLENARKRVPYLLSLILNVYVLMINDTLGAFLGVFFACIFMTALWLKVDKNVGIRAFVPLGVVVIITIISSLGLIPCSVHSVTGNTIGQSIVDLVRDIFRIKNKAADANTAGSNRWGIWKDTLEMIIEHPIVGHGPDVMYDKAGRWVIDTPHNEYLECAFYLGIPGLILYVTGLIMVLVDKCKRLKELPLSMLIAAGASVAYLVSAFFGVRKFNDVCFFFMFMGLLVAKDNLKKN